MKKIILIVCIAAMSFASCSKYDDVALWNKSMDMDSRISDLEALCQQLNGEIQSLQAIVAASQSGDCIISVVPVMQDGEEIGYTISFAQSDPVTIYHGKDGADGKYDEGYTPQIGVKQDTDGYYYWILDGEWLAGNGGQKILAEGKEGREGTDGNDGVTPQLKIEDGYWFVSCNNGESWEKLEKAAGENGVDGDSFFKDIDASNSDYVVFTLADGTEIKLPKYSQLAVTFDNDGVVEMKPNDTSEVSYTIVSSLSEIEIEVVASSGINAKIVKTTGVTGTIHIATGSSIDDDSHILVFVTNGKTTIMKKLLITEYIDDDEDDDLQFPDPIFRAYVLQNFDKDKDGKISQEEAEAVTDINVNKTQDTSNSNKIKSLKGIEYFTNLGRLLCEYNALTDLDLSKNTQLFILNCSNNNLTNLDVSQNVKLVTFICSFNKLESLDVSMLTKLDGLSCYNNLLTQLDVSNNVNLNSLSCYDNYLSELDLAKNVKLKVLHCHNNNLTELDLSATNLGHSGAQAPLYCNGNPLEKLYLKKGWIINYITRDRSEDYIPAETEIIYVE